jgi:hypothetical protein
MKKETEAMKPIYVLLSMTKQGCKIAGNSEHICKARVRRSISQLRKKKGSDKKNNMGEKSFSPSYTRDTMQKISYSQYPFFQKECVDEGE